MAKRWKIEEDEMLFAFGIELADVVSGHDLGRSFEAGPARVAKLIELGVWDVLEVKKAAKDAHWIGTGHRHEWEPESVVRAQWMLRNAPAILASMESDQDLQPDQRLSEPEQALLDLQVEYHTEFERGEEIRLKYEQALDVIQCLAEAAKAVPGTAPDQAELIDAYAEAAEMIAERAARRTLLRSRAA